MLTFPLNTPHLQGNLDTQFPCSIAIPSPDQNTQIATGDTAFGFVAQHSLEVQFGDKKHLLTSGMYFSLPGPATLSGFHGFLAIRHGFSGMFNCGGPIENVGRLKYIDGCSDSLLLAPMLKGDACFNFLYVPPGIDQTAHTHPSARIGMVVSGEGYCLTEGRKNPLVAGTAFVLEVDEIHSFHTDQNHLRIVVFHPDSDFGPTHEIHPMVNRSYVNGVSLQGENNYRTLEILEFVQ